MGVRVKTVSIKIVLLVATLGLSTTGCSTITESPDAVSVVYHGSEPASHSHQEPAPHSHKVGNPYVVKGVRYVPRVDPDYNVVGRASWYGRRYHGRRTASGEIFDMNSATAAHLTLLIGTQVQVTNIENGRSVVLRINDRGPFVRRRIIDVSRHAARVLGFVQKGTARVRVQLAQPAPG